MVSRVKYVHWTRGGTIAKALRVDSGIVQTPPPLSYTCAQNPTEARSGPGEKPDDVIPIYHADPCNNAECNADDEEVSNTDGLVSVKIVIPPCLNLLNAFVILPVIVALVGWEVSVAFDGLLRSGASRTQTNIRRMPRMCAFTNTKTREEKQQKVTTHTSQSGASPRLSTPLNTSCN